VAAGSGAGAGAVFWLQPNKTMVAAGIKILKILAFMRVLQLLPGIVAEAAGTHVGAPMQDNA